MRFTSAYAAVVGDEPLRLDSLHYGMSPLSYVKFTVVGKLWTDVTPLDREIG